MLGTNYLSEAYVHITHVGYKLKFARSSCFLCVI